MGITNTRDVNQERNTEVRGQVKHLAEECGVSLKFISNITGLDYGLFNKWVNGKKNYVNRNLDIVEKVLQEKYTSWGR